MTSLPRRAGALALLLLVGGVVALLALRSFGVPPRLAPWTPPSPILAGSATPEPSGILPDPDAAMSVLAAEVAMLRQLAPVALGAAQRLARTTLVEAVAAAVARDWPPAGLPASEAVLLALGLRGAADSWVSLAGEVLSGGMLAWYDGHGGRMLLADDATSGAALQVAYAHELTHALGMAAFPDAISEPPPTELDARLAWLALREGDARSTMLLWGLDHLGPEQLLGATSAQVPEGFGAPGWLVEILAVPHLAGATFVSQLFAAGGWDAVNAAYADPPTSTEQVLHYAKYLANEVPLTVEAPLSHRALWRSGWQETQVATMGEAWLAAWLGEFGTDDQTAAIAAAGWGGDRLQLLTGRDGAWGLGWRIAWDAPLDAIEFAHAYSGLRDQLGVATELITLNERESLLLNASSDAVLQSMVLLATSTLAR